LDIKSLNLKNECKYQVNKEIIERNKSYPEKTIAVFDTSFGGETIFKSEDILEFLRGILELIENHPEYAMIFKMKIPWGYHTILSPDIKKYYTLLSNHPRCVLLNGFDIELSEVIAAADFVISACFTSPTIEAWGAKIPSIYYDATSRFKGYYYDNFPKFVAHDYQELEKLVEYWFKNTGSDELEHYINKWIIPEIDKFADGKGLTRFRNLLIQSEKNEISQPTDF
jgi:polysaccharide biosynthesis PFTS motif protein